MPTPSAQLLSRTEYLADGVTTSWDFSFSGGYISRDHVKAYSETSTGIRTNLTIMPGDFVGDYTLTISPAIASGDTLVIYRDTPKDIPIVNYTDGGRVTEASLDLNAEQAVFIAAETTDIVNTSDAIAAGAAAASAAASAAAALAAIAPVPAAVAAAVAASEAAVAAAAAITLPLPLVSGGTGASYADLPALRTGIDVPSRSGVGATGSWGINVTGNAATATSAVTASSATTAGSATNATNATNATTQALSDVSTKIATTAFVDGAISRPYATAALASSQSVATASYTVVSLTDESDPTSSFTASQFKPAVAGWYFCNAGAQLDIASPGFASIFKNGGEFRRGWWGDTGTPAKDFSVAALVYLNGTTDYVDLRVYQHSGSSRTLQGVASVTWFDAHFVRRA